MRATSVTIIDGATLTTTTLAVGNGPVEAWVNPVIHHVYVSNVGDATVSVIGGVPPNALQFVAVTPCRVVDTRNQNGPFGGPPIAGGTSRSFPIPQGSCSIPATAAAYSLNVTAVPSSSLGYLTIWPTGEPIPLVSTLNSPDGRIKANAAIVPGGYQDAVSVYVTNTSQVILDIDGYFEPVSGSTLAFYPLTPCRVADTRDTTKPPGLGPPFLSGNAPRNFPVLSSTCGIPNSAQAYSFNVTAIPRTRSLGFLTVWPEGQTQPLVSTLNDPKGTIVANAAIVPAGTGGGITAFPTDDTDLVNRHQWLLRTGWLAGRTVAISGGALQGHRHPQGW